METFQSYLASLDLDYLSQMTKTRDLKRVEEALAARRLSPEDLAVLLSPAAMGYLEDMALRSRSGTLKHFGKAVHLYTPLYLSNYCVNHCAYCGYSPTNAIRRHMLTMEDIEAEAKAIAATGLRHILVLTGESRVHTSVDYILQAVTILKKYFDSISIEIYPLEEEEYRAVIEAGVDGLTIYQETYDPDRYDQVHIAGPKKDYAYRLAAPERAARAGMRSVNVGALLGLSDYRMDALLTGLHAAFLQKNHPELELGVSFPRLRPTAGHFEPQSLVDDPTFVQVILAIRNFIPEAGTTLSTRESADLRNNLIPLGITKLSAGVTTAVGGHDQEAEGDAQFEIADGRSVEDMANYLRAIGYQPVFKDWMAF